MNDEQLFALIKAIDSHAVRIPPGVRKIVDAVIAIEREECAKICEARCGGGTTKLNTLRRSADAIRNRSNP